MIARARLATICKLAALAALAMFASAVPGVLAAQEPAAPQPATPDVPTDAPPSRAKPKIPLDPLGKPAEGAPFRGRLTAAVTEPDGMWRFVGADGAHELRLSDLALWGRFVEPAGSLEVVLAGSGILAVDTARIEDDRLVATSRTFGTLNLPLKLVAGVVFQPPADRAKCDRLVDRVLSLTGRTDRVILDNGDELTGTIAALDNAKLRLQSDVGAVDLELGKVAAVLFNPILIDKPNLNGLRVLVGFRDGSRATALAVTADRTGARLKLAGGVELAAPTEAIVALQPLGGRLEYVSDLKPESYRHIPFLELAWPYQTDRSVSGSLLRAGDSLCLKGLGMHSPSRITYELNGAYRRFDAEVAIDAEAGARGSVVFRVFTDDGDGAWHERAKSEIVRGGEDPVPISADLKGARRMSLLVDFADRGDEQDHADWLDARLVR